MKIVLMSFDELRRQVLRRVGYAANTAALEDNSLPPDGPYDTALTNGLAAIVADTWPGEETSASGRMKPARELLNVIEGHGNPFAHIKGALLDEALELTQPFRHGRADDEWARIRLEHLDALIALDQHQALQLLDEARSCRDVDELVHVAFNQRAAEELPFDPKDRLLIPGLDECPSCLRPTFLLSGWDAFGGTMSAGGCIACGYQRSASEAEETAIVAALARAAGGD